MVDEYDIHDPRPAEEQIHTKRISTLNQAANYINSTGVKTLDNVKFNGGGKEYNQNKGEISVPPYVSLKITNPDDLAALSIISKVCDWYDLKVWVPEHIQEYGESKRIRLVDDNEEL